MSGAANIDRNGVIMNQSTIDRIRRFTDDRDWDRFHTPANLAKSISIEANELLECFQWDDQYVRDMIHQYYVEVWEYVLTEEELKEKEEDTEVYR